jgi:ketosteroid isomerase-like protein
MGDSVMTDRAIIESVMRATYAARTHGDLDGTMANFADDAVFEFNGRGTNLPELSAKIQTARNIRPVMKQLIDGFRFSDWQQIALLVEGNRALLHWRATVTSPANGKSAKFDVFDLVTISDGKIVVLHQSTDTAAVMSLVGA